MAVASSAVMTVDELVEALHELMETGRENVSFEVVGVAYGYGVEGMLLRKEKNQFVVVLAPVEHHKDSDCEGFVEDGVCTVCNVGNGECSSCNGVRYHELGCPNG